MFGRFSDKTNIKMNQTCSLGGLGDCLVDPLGCQVHFFRLLRQFRAKWYLHLAPMFGTCWHSIFCVSLNNVKKGALGRGLGSGSKKG